MIIKHIGTEWITWFSRISTWMVEGARRKADYLHAVGFIGEGFQHGCFARAGMALNANNSIRAGEYRLNRLILVGGERSALVASKSARIGSA